jgi:hypothetical protein
VGCKPVRLRDLEEDNRDIDNEWNRATQQICDNQNCDEAISFNDFFNPLSWIYYRSELREGIGYHLFERDGEFAVAVASEEWTEENTL